MDDVNKNIIPEEFLLCTENFTSFSACVKSTVGNPLHLVETVIIAIVRGVIYLFQLDSYLMKYELNNVINMYTCDAPVDTYNLLQHRYDDFINCVEVTFPVITAADVLQGDHPEEVGVMSLVAANEICATAYMIEATVSALICAIIPPMAVETHVDETIEQAIVEQLICSEEAGMCHNIYDGFIL